MNTFNRRRFLAFIGAGVVVVAGGAALTIRQLSANGRVLSFKAVTSLPAKPMPAYASYVISGQVHLNDNTGSITKQVFAGAPEAITDIPLLARSVRVTGAQQQGNTWHITGVVETQTQAGEETTFDMLLDPSRNIAQSTFFGSPIQLELLKLSAPS